MPAQTYDLSLHDGVSLRALLESAQRLSLKDIGQLQGLTTWMRGALAIVAHISLGSLVIVLPDGRKIRFDGNQPGDTGVIIVRDNVFAKKLLLNGGIGFAEAYLDGLWDSPDLSTLLRVIAANNSSIGTKARGKRFFELFEWLRTHLLQRNSRSGARRNIEYHYDLGNDFYALWLDASMTYSAALFQENADSLASAQQQKYRALAARIELRPEHHLLEIGCGWGGFAEFAARETGCQVTGVTISPQQFEFAKKRMFENGLAEKVKIELRDYRDVDARYDRIASIEMFEAVGEAYWPVYFKKLYACLKQGGLAGLQLITIAEQQFESYRRGGDFIQRYIFPGGMLISPSALRDQIAGAGLLLREHYSFGQDYARTLRHWQESFQQRWSEIETLGYDSRFRRMWTYYLSYCESGFSSGNTDVLQITLART